jgi:hypothetical protein
MPAADTYMRKTAAISSATTTYPTGVIAPGGSAVDEMELWHAPLHQSLYAVVHVPQASGGTPSLIVSVETDDNTSFSSAATPIVMENITAAGTYVSKASLGADRNPYARFEAVTDSTTNFGTVVFHLTPYPDRYRVQ